MESSGKRKSWHTIESSTESKYLGKEPVPLHLRHVSLSTSDLRISTMYINIAMTGLTWWIFEAMQLFPCVCRRVRVGVDCQTNHPLIWLVHLSYLGIQDVDFHQHNTYLHYRYLTIVQTRYEVKQSPQLVFIDCKASKYRQTA